MEKEGRCSQPWSLSAQKECGTRGSFDWWFVSCEGVWCVREVRSALRKHGFRGSFDESMKSVVL